MHLFKAKKDDSKKFFDANQLNLQNDCLEVKSHKILTQTVQSLKELEPIVYSYGLFFDKSRGVDVISQICGYDYSTKDDKDRYWIKAETIMISHNCPIIAFAFANKTFSRSE